MTKPMAFFHEKYKVKTTITNHDNENYDNDHNRNKHDNDYNVEWKKM